MSAAEEFREELSALLNKYNIDTITNTPDFILARYVVGVLAALNDRNERVLAWNGGGLK